MYSVESSQGCVVRLRRYIIVLTGAVTHSHRIIRIIADRVYPHPVSLKFSLYLTHLFLHTASYEPRIIRGASELNISDALVSEPHHCMGPHLTG